VASLKLQEHSSTPDSTLDFRIGPFSTDSAVVVSWLMSAFCAGFWTPVATMRGRGVIPASKNLHGSGPEDPSSAPMASTEPNVTTVIVLPLFEMTPQRAPATIPAFHARTKGEMFTRLHECDSLIEDQVVSAATPEHITQVGLGFWASKTLLSAVELGVFSTLADVPRACRSWRALFPLPIIALSRG
jgi:hypothetical protein